MDTQNSPLGIALREWIIAIGVLLASFFVAMLAQALLKHLSRKRNWQFFEELTPSISNLIYIVGLKGFADVAPLHGKLELWFEHGTYVLSIFFLLVLIHQAALYGIEWSIDKASSSETLHRGFIPLIRNMLTLFIFFAGSIMVLKHFHYDVMSLLAALGVGSLAVGLASKDTL